MGFIVHGGEAKLIVKAEYLFYEGGIYVFLKRKEGGVRYIEGAQIDEGRIREDSSKEELRRILGKIIWQTIRASGWPCHKLEILASEAAPSSTETQYNYDLSELQELTEAHQEQI